MFGLFKRKASSGIDGARVAALQAQYFPRISIQQHAYAKAKIARERQKVIQIRWPEGYVTPLCVGDVTWDDLQAAQGYSVHLSDYDRFGWPKGHPESPVNIATRP
jgi:hypothetical protein